MSKDYLKKTEIAVGGLLEEDDCDNDVGVWRGERDRHGMQILP